MLEHMMVAQEVPREQPDWHLAFEFYPLHRAAEKTKIRASVETALELFLNDVLPEDAAQQLARLEIPHEPIDANALRVIVPVERTTPAEGAGPGRRSMIGFLECGSKGVPGPEPGRGGCKSGSSHHRRKLPCERSGASTSSRSLFLVADPQCSRESRATDDA
jgi:hypothetical protein